jgi:hypothetical protein
MVSLASGSKASEVPDGHRQGWYESKAAVSYQPSASDQTTPNFLQLANSIRNLNLGRKS